MRTPSVAKLRKYFPHLSEDEAALIRAIGRATDKPEKLAQLIETYTPKTAKYVSKLHNSPWGSAIWRTTVALHAMDEIMGTFGVEGLGPGRSGDYAPPYEYLNTGDPYTTTLIYRLKTDSLSIGSWGDIAEKHPSW